jgi:hypothetical protein
MQILKSAPLVKSLCPNARDRLVLSRNQWRDKRHIQHPRTVIVCEYNHQPTGWIQKRVIAGRHVNHSTVS